MLLKNTCSGYMMIVGGKDGHLVYNPSLTVIDDSSQEVTGDGVMKNNLSGFIIIFLQHFS